MLRSSLAVRLLLLLLRRRPMMMPRFLHGMLHFWLWWRRLLCLPVADFAPRASPCVGRSDGKLVPFQNTTAARGTYLLLP